MAERLIAVTPAEITHLEVECPNPDCRAISTLPIKEPPAAGTTPFHQCPFCGTGDGKDDARLPMRQLVKHLFALSQPGAIKVRLLCQDRIRND